MLLQRITQAVEDGVAARHLQRLPHVTLLNPEYYHTTMKPLMAEWAFIWLQQQVPLLIWFLATNLVHLLVSSK